MDLKKQSTYKASHDAKKIKFMYYKSRPHWSLQVRRLLPLLPLLGNFVYNFHWGSRGGNCSSINFLENKCSNVYYCITYFIYSLEIILIGIPSQLSNQKSFPNIFEVPKHHLKSKQKNSVHTPSFYHPFLQHQATNERKV